jgi:hypothetical protein
MSLPYAYHLKILDVQDLCVVTWCTSAGAKQNCAACA